MLSYGIVTNLLLLFFLSFALRKIKGRLEDEEHLVSRRFIFDSNHHFIGWSSWQQYAACSTLCVSGFENQTRKCCDTGDNRLCYNIPWDQLRSKIGTCPNDGRWGTWGTWSACSVTCGQGIKQRVRACVFDQNRPHDKDCPAGGGTENRSCTKQDCRVNGSWGSWSPWSTCTGDCTAANKQRFRNCDNPRPYHGGSYCVGDAIESQNCLPQHCTTAGPKTSAAYTNSSAPTTTVGAQIDFKCYECDTTIPEVCVALKRETICHEPYCINEFTNTADGKKLLDRRCGTKLECDKDWWKDTSDRDKCTLFDVTETVTNYVHCTFCCVDELCNDPIIPDAKSQYKPTS